jgi:hypothetical protein
MSHSDVTENQTTKVAGSQARPSPKTLTHLTWFMVVIVKD